LLSEVGRNAGTSDVTDLGQGALDPGPRDAPSQLRLSTQLDG
jgi:hypothetical protein